MCIPHLWIRYWSIAISYCILFDFLRGRDHPRVCQRKLTVVAWSCSIFRSNAWEKSNPWIGISALKKVVKPINLQGRQVRLLETEIFFGFQFYVRLWQFSYVFIIHFCWVMPSPVDRKSILGSFCLTGTLQHIFKSPYRAVLKLVTPGISNWERPKSCSLRGLEIRSPCCSLIWWLIVIFPTKVLHSIVIYCSVLFIVYLSNYPLDIPMTLLV